MLTADLLNTCPLFCPVSVKLSGLCSLEQFLFVHWSNSTFLFVYWNNSSCLFVIGTIPHFPLFIGTILIPLCSLEQFLFVHWNSSSLFIGTIPHSSLSINDSTFLFVHWNNSSCLFVHCNNSSFLFVFWSNSSFLFVHWNNSSFLFVHWSNSSFLFVHWSNSSLFIGQAVIAAAMTDKSPFVVPLSHREEANAAKQSLATAASDHLTVYRAYLG